MILNSSNLRAAAKRSLEQTSNARRMILIHTGVVLLITLLLSVADFLLEQQIGTTGGLSGLDTRSLLSTVQAVLRLAQIIALPFWQIGYTYFTLRVARGETANTAHLLEGFRRFGPVLRLSLLFAVIGFFAVMVSSYAGSMIFMLTPFSAPLTEAMNAMSGSVMDETATLELLNAVMSDIAIPLMLIVLMCLLVIGAFLFFRYRMAYLWLMDHPDSGALSALRGSKMLMRGNCMAVFKIDLGFWWFYLLDVLVSLVCYGDLLLAAIGVPLPIDSTVAYFLFLILYLAAQLGLYCWKQNEVSVTYAHAYQALSTPASK